MKFTVKELIDKLSEYPSDIEVLIDCEEYCDCIIEGFDYNEGDDCVRIYSREWHWLCDNLEENL